MSRGTLRTNCYDKKLNREQKIKQYDIEGMILQTLQTLGDQIKIKYSIDQQILLNEDHITRLSWIRLLSTLQFWASIPSSKAIKSCSNNDVLRNWLAFGNKYSNIFNEWSWLLWYKNPITKASYCYFIWMNVNKIGSSPEIVDERIKVVKRVVSYSEIDLRSTYKRPLVGANRCSTCVCYENSI